MTIPEIKQSLMHITSKDKYAAARNLKILTFDVDPERGFTSVTLVKRANAVPVTGYAKRHLSEDRQNDIIGINRALLDAVKRSCGLKRRQN